MRRRLRLLASPLLVLLLLQSDASAELLLVFAVSRHGARNVLPKTALLAEPSAGTTLLAAGLRQCYQAGLAFRSRYLDAANCSASSPNTCLAPAGLPSPARYGIVSSANTSFSNYNTRVVSSALDRTLLSARSFLAGAFAYGLGGLATPSALLSNGAQLPPIFSAAGRDEDDVLVRAYSKCPLYLLRLLAWYSSPEFDAVHISSAPLRALVAQLPGWPAGVSNDTSLVNWYNIYDAFSVSRSGYGDPMPTVNTTVWAQMKDLADWLETRKSAPSLAGNLLGGPLLQELSNRIAAAVAAASAGSLLTSYTRLMLMSGHYNSQLALLAALNVTLPSMPATASLLAFELHRSAARCALRDAGRPGSAVRGAAAALRQPGGRGGRRGRGMHACRLDRSERQRHSRGQLHSRLVQRVRRHSPDALRSGIGWGGCVSAAAIADDAGHVQHAHEGGGCGCGHRTGHRAACLHVCVGLPSRATTRAGWAWPGGSRGGAGGAGGARAAHLHNTR
jgi:hypothetical protein